MNSAAALHLDVIVARHALQRRGHRRWGNVEFLREARADRHLVFFEHLPDGLQIVFLRYTGLPASHFFSSTLSCWPLAGALAAAPPTFLRALECLPGFSDMSFHRRRRGRSRASLL